MKHHEQYGKRTGIICFVKFVTILISLQLLGACAVHKKNDSTKNDLTQSRFTLVAIPDTQQYYRAEKGKVYFAKQVDWIVNNAYTKDNPEDSVPFKNIVFVTHLGDVIEDGMGNENHPEWLDSLKHMEKLDHVLPYSVALGDHDYNGNERPVDGHTAFVKYYGPERYKKYSWYGGSSKKGTSHYQYFSGAGITFLHINIEVDAPDSSKFAHEDDQLKWAQTILDANKNTPTILTTHAYLTDEMHKGTNGKQVPYDDDGRFVGHEPSQEVSKGPRHNEKRRGGLAIWRDLVKKNNQIFMVLGGNYHEYLRDQGGREAALNGEYHQVSINDFNQPVIEVLVNYQDYKNGGDGLIRLINFDFENNTVLFETYNTFEDSFRRMNLQPARAGDKTNPLASEFTIPLNFQERFVY
ncbi:MAG: hypothetical protein QTN59_20680 [Candidatus Electrothrix communis]|nr:MAG: hypothetical protein QTN59_20680 [Candidatus Electrothrix communis]